jgi:hypothetical protein
MSRVKRRVAVGPRACGVVGRREKKVTSGGMMAIEGRHAVLNDAWVANPLLPTLAKGCGNLVSVSPVPFGPHPRNRGAVRPILQ